MEKLIVKNFLVIKEAEFDVGRFNVVVGEQASGKSILAKLLYFFREFIAEHYFNSIPTDLSRKDTTEKGLETFKKYFPEYCWNNSEFEIIYHINEEEVFLSKTKKIHLSYSKKLDSLKKKITKEIDQKSETEDLFQTIGKRERFIKIKQQYIYKGGRTEILKPSIFVPAVRSLFLNIKKNIFFLIEHNINIDPFSKVFGSKYERARDMYFDSTDNPIRYKTIQLIKNILKGEYVHEEDEEWIVTENQRVKVSHSSSGQQESLPMLLPLAVHPFQESVLGGGAFFIEEPEAHLFPIAQKQVIDIFSLIYKNQERDFVITTHSPYILTAINNLILMEDVRNNPKIGQEKMGDEFDPDLGIKYEDVRAYTIKDGVLVSIMNDEERLIGLDEDGNDIIDQVSDTFESEFNRLLELQMENA